MSILKIKDFESKINKNRNKIESLCNTARKQRSSLLSSRRNHSTSRSGSNATFDSNLRSADRGEMTGRSLQTKM